MANIQELLDRIAGERGIRKSVDGYGQNPSVPDASNRTQPRDQGGRFVSADYSEPAEGQPYRSSNDAISNVDTEASRRFAPGSLVQAAIDRGRDQRNAASYPQHTLAGAIMEAAVKHQVQVLGHVAGTQPGVQSSTDGPNTLVGEDNDENPYVFHAFQQQVNAMTQAFKASVGRYPVFGAPSDANDVEFQRAYAALRNKFWPADGGASDDPYNDTGSIN